MKNTDCSYKRGTYLDPWESHKDDFLVWRRFWALWELRRKWKWADWFYRQLDRITIGDKKEIVAPIDWSLFPGENYMKLCLWIAILKSVHEGLTEGLDSFDIPQRKRMRTIKKSFSRYSRGGKKISSI